ncbi:MAG: dihydrolipoyllysine-residue succinyltransferase [Actinomycetota bacterium]
MPKTPVVMPKMSMTMTEGEVVEITVSVGQQISAGDVVAVVGTDKTDMEVESDHSGTVVEVVAGPGQVLEVGSPLLVLETEGEDLLAGMFATPEPAAPVVETPVVQAPAPTPIVEQVVEVTPVAAREILAMPGARKLAKEQGIDLAKVKPASPQGIIKQSDLGVSSAKLDKARAQIASVVETSLQIPQFSISGTIKLKAKLPKNFDERFIVLARAWVKTLAKHPQLNQQYQAGSFTTAQTRIAALVKTELGFVSPVFSVDGIAGAAWEEKANSVLALAKQKKIPLENLSGSTTSITDLSEFGIEQANTLLFAPQSSGFNIGAIKEKKGKTKLSFTLVVDHRIADPGDAAEVVKTFEKELGEALGGNS